MTNLLAATDLSARSDRALDRALALAGQLEGQVTVLHVVDEDLPRAIAEQHRAEAERIIDSQISESPAAKDGRASRKVVVGRADLDILREAAAVQADIVVLGTHRETMFRGMFAGTTAERVLRRSERPVLVVKERPRGPYRRILIALDFSLCSRRALDAGLRLFPGAELHLIHAYEVPFAGFLRDANTRDEIRRQHEADMQRLIADEAAAFLACVPAAAPQMPVLRRGSAVEVIGEELERVRPDLLVLGTHGRTGAAHALLGSVAEYFLSAPQWDVLAVKAW